MLAIVTGVGALIATCREAPTAPTGHITISASVLSGPTMYSDSAGRQWLRCNVQVAAYSSLNRTATWMTAQVAYFTALDSMTPFGTYSVPAENVGSAWGADSILADAARTARWTVSATVPFSVRFAFTYQVRDGPLDTASTAATCAPDVPAGSPPTINTFAIQPYTSLQPGDTLHISYAVTSPVGLWQSAITLSGPCDSTLAFPEQDQPSASRNLDVVIPAVCGLGTQLVLTAAVQDARLQISAQRLILAALTDTRPPKLSWLSFDLFSGGPVVWYGGTFFTGDTLEFSVTAADNHVVRRLLWGLQPAGWLDSMTANSVSASFTRDVLVQPAWSGSQTLRVWATDASGNTSDTAASLPDSILMRPTVGPAPVVTPLSGIVYDMVFDVKRSVVYVLQRDEGRITVVSTANPAVVGSIALPGPTRDIDLSPSGDSLVAVIGHSLAIADLTQPSPRLALVPLAGADSLDGLQLRVARTGIAVFSAATPSGTTRIFTLDLASRTLRLRSDVADLGAGMEGDLERSADRSVVVINGGTPNSFRRYDASSDTFEPAQTARFGNTRPAVDGTGAHVAAAGDIYDATLQYLVSARAQPRLPAPAALAPDGQTYYSAPQIGNSRRGIIRTKVADGSPLDRIPFGGTVSMLRASPDGATLAAAGCATVCGIAIINVTQLH